MAGVVHLTVPGRPVMDTRHKCPFPRCTWLLPQGVPACKGHRPAWSAMSDDERAALIAAREAQS
jgi:hypothetical protein